MDQDGNHPEQVDRLVIQADSLIRTQNLDRARRFLDSAYARIPNAGVMDLYRKYDLLRSSYLSDDVKVNYLKSQIYTDSLFLLFDHDAVKERYPKEFALLHLYKGDVLHHQKQNDEAYGYFFRGKLLMEASGDPCLTSQYTRRMANMHYQLKKFDRATTFYKQSFREVMQCEDGTGFDNLFVEPQGALSNLALCYTALGKLDSAVYCYDQALQFIEQNKHKFPDKEDFAAMARGVIYGNQAAAYQKKGDFKRATALLIESVRINSQKGYYNKDAQLSLAGLCAVYLDDRQYDKAYQGLQALRVSLDTLPHDTGELRWQNLQWQYWEKVGQFEKSQQMLKGYLTLKDSLERKKRSFDGLEQALQQLDSEHRIEILQKKEELNRVYLWVALAISLMVMIIAGLIWYNWKRAQRNVTELASLNQRLTDRNTQLQNTMTALEQSRQENNRLLKVVAHDLRTPVSSIMMAVDLLLDGQPTTREPKFFLEMIKTSADNSLNLINNLLQSNSVPNQKEEVNLEEFLTSGVDMLRLKASAKQQTIDLKANAIPVWMDRQKMWRVIGNLLTNAIKFSPAGSTIFVRAQKQDQTVRISIQDHGIGIPKQLKDKVFDLFTEAGREGTSGEKTFGLGLAISRQIVEAHEGKLWFESKENQGTTFFIELPL
ncbi:tetratricopeptide repeat-containing sensor histidine kinase [Larkinella sp. VNQ87]|uniref:tetratricopeptide repeat-containing sensor histidine kinase n=1 Tax=Larkinella sp. VNQ87 TaxID=3400921 RepID=UPI003C05DF1E